MQAPNIAPSASPDWDAAYEKKAIAVLAIGFGLVGLDRFIINPMFPVIAKDLGLNYQDLGLISAVLALTWGLASIVTGRLSDRIGRKRVLVPAVIIFSLLVATTGFASGLISLLVIRGLMGLAEGAYVPASIVSTVEASKPSRVGLNIGIQQTAAPLIGLGLGPIIAVALLKVVPSWHWVFAVVAVPGLIVAWYMHRILQDRVTPTVVTESTRTSWLEVLRYRNIVFAMLGMCCFLSGFIALSAFMPNYLTDHMKLSLDQMGMVLAGLGLGSFIGMVAVPAVSDKWGRKLTMLVALVIEIFALWVLMTIGAEPVKLFAALFVVAFMNVGVIGINVGPLTNSSVPVSIATAATGVVVGVGEIIGGAVAPAVAGGLAQKMGIHIIPMFALVAIVLALVVVAFGIKEPRPEAVQS